MCVVKKIKKSYCSKPASFLFCEIFNTVKIKDNDFIDKVNANIYGLRTKDSEKMLKFIVANANSRIVSGCLITLF